MSVAGWLLLVNEGGWRLAPLSESMSPESVRAVDDAGLDERAQAVRRLLHDSGDRSAPIILALESRHCMSATVATTQSGRKRQQAWAFALEEQVPVASEDFVADFLPIEQDQALGVCVELAWIGPIVEALENQGLRVPVACPMVCLVAAQAIERDPDLDAVIVQGDDMRGTDVLELRDGRPLTWRWYPHDSDEWRTQLQQWRQSSATPARLGLVTANAQAMASSLAEQLAAQVIAVADDPIVEACRYGCTLIHAGQPPWFNFRQGPLATRTSLQVYHRPTLALLTAVAFALLCAIGVTQWRAIQYRALETQFVNQQAEVFASLFPQQRLPAGIKARLISEHRKLAGMSGQDDGTGVPTETSALMHLERVLEHLPADLVFSITGLTIEPDTIRVEGEALSHGDADRIASSLRQSTWFEVEPPRTQARREGGVSFVFTMNPLAGGAAKQSVASGPSIQPAANGGTP